MTRARLAVAAITLDFGNTLVRVDRAGLRGVVEDTADEVASRGIARERGAFLTAWQEERDRQFREEVPQFRETTIQQRAVRVIARARGMPVPAADERWDDEAASALVDASDVQAVVDAYSAAFLRRMVPEPEALPTLERLAGRGFALAILSNWPLALTIDRFAEANGWLPHLRSIVVSERVGTIKPHERIFRAAEAALDLPEGSEILHVGDDWAADVVGASRAGWRTAYLRGHQDDTPLPTSNRDAGDVGADGSPIMPDLEIDELSDLDLLVERAPAPAPAR